MKMLAIELRKEKRTGVIPVLLAVGALGALYAFANFSEKRHASEPAPGANGCFADPALRYAHGPQYVWYRCGGLYDL